MRLDVRFSDTRVSNQHDLRREDQQQAEWRQGLRAHLEEIIVVTAFGHCSLESFTKK